MEYLLTFLNFGLFFWFVVAVLLRRNRPLHMGMMTFGFSLDVALLLHVEFALQAVEKAAEQVSTGVNPMMMIHISIAGGLTVLYPFLLYSGGRVSAGGSLRRHRRLALPFLAARLALAVTAFLVVNF